MQTLDKIHHSHRLAGRYLHGTSLEQIQQQVEAVNCWRGFFVFCAASQGVRLKESELG